MWRSTRERERERERERATRERDERQRDRERTSESAAMIVSDGMANASFLSASLSRERQRAPWGTPRACERDSAKDLLLAPQPAAFRPPARTQIVNCMGELTGHGSSRRPTDQIEFSSILETGRGRSIFHPDPPLSDRMKTKWSTPGHSITSRTMTRRGCSLSHAIRGPRMEWSFWA